MNIASNICMHDMVFYDAKFVHNTAAAQFKAGGFATLVSDNTNRDKADQSVLAHSRVYHIAGNSRGVLVFMARLLIIFDTCTMQLTVEADQASRCKGSENYM